MTSREDVLKRYDKGLVILAQLFEMKKPELLAKLKSICGSKVPEHMFEGSTTKKTSSDDVPENIEIWHYDCLRVSPFGVTFEPEHGDSRDIIDFNDHFVL